MKKVLLICVLFFFIAGSAYATAIQWKVSEGGNGHWYEIVRYELDDPELYQGYLPWISAYILASPTWGSYLATITSTAENAFVWDLASEGAPSGISGDNHPAAALWLGGYQTKTDDEPLGNWAWANGEDWWDDDGKVWAPGEPNNGMGGTQNYLHFWPGDGLWDDMEGDLLVDGRYMTGFIVESEHNPNPVPEPATMLLLGIGLIGVGGIGRKYFKK